jgi:hypothetical protein
VNPWIKPIKFAVSIGIYYWTIAWLLQYVAQAPAAAWIGTGTFWLLVYEMVCIGLQAARGLRSHFNASTPFNQFVFATMGIAIFVNTLLASWLLWLFLAKRTGLAPGYLVGIRIGLLLAVLASLQGLIMVRRMAHAVGAPDDGPGLPFLNWSRRGGDLRVAHFLGLHGLQVMIVCGYLFSGRPTTVAAAGIIYALVTVQFLRRGLHGRPVIALPS